MVIGTVTELGMRVRERREELGMSQTMLADRVRTTRQWISYLERGKQTTEVGMVLDTLRALGLIVDVRTRDPKS
ncbi:MAG: helix-turn-helix domain-containing protein [Gemmatimonadetes bacterium]|nr:helix-turn-helix domain-containing protein [Gemmatimonadota bacterium]